MNTTMGKLTLSIVVTTMIVLPLGVIFPVAHADTIPQGNIIGGSGGSAPVVLGMWEQDMSPYIEDGDITHMLDGAQFLPPCKSGAGKKISFYVIVTGNDRPEDIQRVTAEFRNKNSPFLGTVTCSRLSDSQGIFAVEHAATANLIAFNRGMETNQVENLLRDKIASVWKGDLDISPRQGSGSFLVTATATDDSNNYSEPFQNSFLYCGVACIEFDFSSVNYGSIGLGQEKIINGDTSFGTGNKPSVQNIGNIPARITIQQDDMGLGKNSDGIWNVQYGTRLGDAGSFSRYYPNDDVIMTGLVKPGEVKSLDFTIRINEGTGSSEGSMKLGYVPTEITEQSYEHAPNMPDRKSVV